MRSVKLLARAALVFCVCAVLLLCGCTEEKLVSADATPAITDTPAPFPSITAAPVTPSPTPIPATPAPTEPPPPDAVTLLFAGDVMGHQKQLDCHKFGSEYDFTDDYKYIRDIVSAADIAAVNLETVLSGEGPYEGWPHFNAPDCLAEALKYAGFDVIETANNHIRDRGDNAMRRTSECLRGMGFAVVGTAPDEETPKYALIEKNGIKVGFVNFARSSNTGYPRAAEPYMNCLKYTGGEDEGYAAMEEEIKALREAGAEFVVVIMHWGTEYQLKNNSAQQIKMQRIADMGADLIIGGHPHVPQNVAEYTSPVTGNNVLIYYSLGNFISNQPYSYGPGGGYCETGAMALIKLVRGEDGGVSIDSAGFITTYALKPYIVKTYNDGEKERTKNTQAYYIVPAAQTAQNPDAYEGAEGNLLKRVQKGVENGARLLGRSGAELMLFKFAEFTDWPW